MSRKPILAKKSFMISRRAIEKSVRAIVDRGQPRSALKEIDIEACGKSRIPLGGLVQRLHQANLDYVFSVMTNQVTPETP